LPLTGKVGVMTLPTPAPSKIVVTGASGNVGLGVLRALERLLPDAEVIGVCRRPPTSGGTYARVRWHAVDLSSSDAAALLAPAMRGADAVIHLALAVQPVRDDDYLRRVNVTGTQAVLTAMVTAGVQQLAYASSLGIYAPGGSGPVSEDWPDSGQASSIYSRHKVIVERILDEFEGDHPEIAVGRFRPTVVVQREAAWLIRSLYLGPLIPLGALRMLRRRRLPVLPLPAGIALQFVPRRRRWGCRSAHRPTARHGVVQRRSRHPGRRRPGWARRRAGHRDQPAGGAVGHRRAQRSAVDRPYPRVVRRGYQYPADGHLEGTP
jgi:hypothetical protein